MSIYALSDLHLSFGTDKPMDVFGGKWENYSEKIYENWQSVVSDEDLVIIPGDVSWATYLEDAYEDFKFIDGLNGRKVILKGNHDYWWSTLRKMEGFLEGNNLSSIKILYNTAFAFDDAAICGTRGWSSQEDEDDIRIYDREKRRLILSLEEAVKLRKDRIIVGMHYPPLSADGNDKSFIEIMKYYGVSDCVYGHLHSFAHKNAIVGDCEGINLMLVSGDYTNFAPVLVK